MRGVCIVLWSVPFASIDFSMRQRMAIFKVGNDWLTELADNSFSWFVLSTMTPSSIADQPHGPDRTSGMQPADNHELVRVHTQRVFRHQASAQASVGIYWNSNKYKKMRFVLYFLHSKLEYTQSVFIHLLVDPTSNSKVWVFEDLSIAIPGGWLFEHI